LIEFGSKTAEKNSAETNRQTNRHYENNGHLAVNQTNTKPAVTAIQESLTFTDWMSEILVIFRVNVSSFDLVIVSKTKTDFCWSETRLVIRPKVSDHVHCQTARFIVQLCSIPFSAYSNKWRMKTKFKMTVLDGMNAFIPKSNQKILGKVRKTRNVGQCPM